MKRRFNADISIATIKNNTSLQTMQITYYDTLKGKWEVQLTSLEQGAQTPGASRLKRKIRRKINISNQEEE